MHNPSEEQLKELQLQCTDEDCLSAFVSYVDLLAVRDEYIDTGRNHSSLDTQIIDARAMLDELLRTT